MLSCLGHSILVTDELEILSGEMIEFVEHDLLLINLITMISSGSITLQMALLPVNTCGE